MQLDDRTAGAPGPVGGFPFVAFEHADIVQRRAAARPEERRPVGVDRPVQPQPLHHERRCGAQAADPCPPVVVTESRVIASTMRCRPVDVGGQHHPVAVEVGAGIAVHPERAGSVVTAVTETPVWNRAPRDSR